MLLEMDYTIGIKHSYRGHRYVLQNVLILNAAQVIYSIEPSSSMGDAAPKVNRYTTTAFADRHILRVVTLCSMSLKRAHHLLNYKACPSESGADKFMQRCI